MNKKASLIVTGSAVMAALAIVKLDLMTVDALAAGAVVTFGAILLVLTMGGKK